MAGFFHSSSSNERLMTRLREGCAFEVDAVLFDMDGTLVDSTAVVVRLWRQWAARHGVDPEAVLAVSHGRRGDDVVAEFALAGTDVPAEVAWLAARELTDRDGIVPVRGAAALLDALPVERVAVVTSATRQLAAVRMGAAGLAVPPVLVGADEVTRGKPDPEGYREAARRLGVDVARCLVVEDAPAGLEAGRASGARVIAVATTLPPNALEAWDWVPDLAALSATWASTNAAGAGDGALLRVTVV